MLSNPGDLVLLFSHFASEIISNSNLYILYVTMNAGGIFLVSFTQSPNENCYFIFSSSEYTFYILIINQPCDFLGRLPAPSRFEDLLLIVILFGGS